MGKTDFEILKDGSGREVIDRLSNYIDEYSDMTDVEREGKRGKYVKAKIMMFSYRLEEDEKKNETHYRNHYYAGRLRKSDFVKDTAIRRIFVKIKKKISQLWKTMFG